MAKRYFYEKYKEMVNSVSGPMTKSSFQSTGKLTPQEFLDSGDSLVQKFPVWEWVSGDEKVMDFLPKNKKFLQMKNCLCACRATSLMTEAPEADGGDDWVATHSDRVAKKIEVEKDAEDDGGDVWGDDDDDGKAPKAEATAASANSELRIYQVSIVYDQYYGSPRIYLFGYDANNQPLTKQQMMDDVYADNREKTVTVDPHPFLQTPCISIHPCRHAETMLRIVQRAEVRMQDEQEEAGVPENERVPFIFPTYLALFIFLKFISSVVPTISYDISVDLDM